MGLALYREFRPKTFEEVIGQNHITKTLKNQVKNKTTTHAYLFTGARGTGKTSCAKIFSKAINCLDNQNGSSCGKCKNCLSLNEVNTDILEIDAASNNRVDEIRELRERVKYPPVIGSKKVYIIDEVHMLTDSAFNALLKTLEEPPEYVVFVLATTEVHKLPATILSRCTRFDFRLLSVDELVSQLKKVFDIRGVSYDQESLLAIARQGQGSVRDSLSIADSVLAYSENNITIEKTMQVLGINDSKSVIEILSAVSNNDIASLVINIKKALSSGKNISLLCKELTECFKNLLLIKQGVEDFNILSIMPSDLAGLKELADKFSILELKTGFEKLSRIELDLKFSLNPENLLLSACVAIMSVGNEQSKQIAQTKTNEPTAQPTKVNPIITNPVEQLVNILSPKQNEQPTNNQQIKQTAELIDSQQIKQGAENQSKLNVPIGRIWGEVLVKVKSKNMFAFSASLQNINKVEANNNTINLHTNDKSCFDTVDDMDKKSVILDILKELGYDFNSVLVEYDQSNKSQADLIKSLKNTFMDKIKIK